MAVSQGAMELELLKNKLLTAVEARRGLVESGQAFLLRHFVASLGNCGISAQNSSIIGVPRVIGIGRPWASFNSVRGSMPRRS
jgi:hypothetical protein